MSRLFFIIVSIFVANFALADGHCTSAPWTKNKCAYTERGACEMAGLSTCRWVSEVSKGVCQPAQGSRMKCHFADRWNCEMQGSSSCRWIPGLTQSNKASALLEASTRTN